VTDPLPAAAPRPLPEPRPFGRGTLGRQLVLRVVAIVAVIALAISAVSVLATQQILLSNVDRELNEVIVRIKGGPSAQPAENLLQPGQPVGTLYALFVEGETEASSSGVLTYASSRPGRPYVHREALSARTNDRLAGTDPDQQPETVGLPDLGRYRIVGYRVDVVPTRQQATLVVGIPLTDADRVLSRVVLVGGWVSGLAVLAAVITVAGVVRRSLRPLNRVAATAQQVSQLQLDRGEVALAMRVPPADADPVSEVGRVGQALNHLLDNVDGALVARQASETKLKQFIADASHELRNPLASIRGYGELTRRGRDQLPDETAYALARMESEATRMSRLVEDLLLLARLDSGPNIELGEVDLAELLINAVSDARVAGGDHRWILDLDNVQPGDRSVMVLGDRYRLHQAVVNLLANARTHTPAGTEVRTSLRFDGPDAVISVADDGPGIPPEIIGQVFERFTRADTSRARAENSNTGSSGLGLAIVAAVVEAHHGRVDAQSEPGGTRFTLRLPRLTND
jgi:two-component system OmpR family sensor kinase